jgi:multicomponent Na+:H+ antiporter subunit D
MAVVLFSLVGIPPLSGFWPKILLFEASFNQHSYLVIAAIIIASFVTLYVIAKMWSEVFWKRQPKGERSYSDDFEKMKRVRQLLLVGPVVLLAIVSVYIGFAAENIMAASIHIAKELINPAAYINAVLGVSGNQ